MNTHPDWQADHDEPPTADELLAYSLGRLPRDEAERVWQRLQQFPELAEIYTAPFPETGAEAGHPHHVPAAEIDRRWNAFTRSIDGERGGRVVRFPGLFHAIAAGLIVVLGALLWQSQMTLREYRAERETPLLPREIVLSEDVPYRGRGVIHPTVPARNVAFKLLLATVDDFEDYRAELRDISRNEPKQVWVLPGLRREDDGSLRFSLGAIDPGKYEIVLDGIRGGTTRRLAKYTFNVTEDRAAGR